MSFMLAARARSLWNISAWWNEKAPLIKLSEISNNESFIKVGSIKDSDILLFRADIARAFLSSRWLNASSHDSIGDGSAFAVFAPGILPRPRKPQDASKIKF